MRPIVMGGHSHVVSRVRGVDATLQCVGCWLGLACILMNIESRWFLGSGLRVSQNPERCLCVRRPTRRPTSTARPARSATAPHRPSPPTAPPPQTASTERAGCRRSAARERISLHFRARMRLWSRDAGLPGCWFAPRGGGWGTDATGFCSHPDVRRSETPSVDQGLGRGSRGAALQCAQALYWPDGKHRCAPGGSVSLARVQPNLVPGMGRAGASPLRHCGEGSRESWRCCRMRLPGKGGDPGVSACPLQPGVRQRSAAAGCAERPHMKRLSI